MFKKLLLTLLLHCFGLFVFAQIIQDGIVFGGNGNQQISKCFIDKIGNKYLVVEYGENFVIDSAGTPLTIEKSKKTRYSQLNNSLAIVKLDKKDTYLHHIKIEGSSFYGSAIDLKFDEENNTYIRYVYDQSDTINLIGKNGTTFRSIIQNYNLTTATGALTASLLFKVSPSGDFEWTNTLFIENTKNLNNIIFTNNSISINNSNEISLFYPVTKNNLGQQSDTIALINNLGQKSLHIVNSPNCLFKFDKFGNFIWVKEPFKNSFNSSKINSFGSIRIDGHISDGQNSYVIHTFTLTASDTFKANGISIPLIAGYYQFFTKLNSLDSVVWVKPIYRNLTSFTFAAAIKLDINQTKNELTICYLNQPSFFQFLLNPIFTSNEIGSYIGRFDTDGNLINESLFVGTLIRCAAYHKNANSLTIIGRTSAFSPKLNAYFPTNTFNSPITFFAYLDSSNNVISAQPIISNNQQMSTGISLNFEMGNPLTDLSGRTFIPGWFRDSITLPCKKLIGDLDKDTVDFGIIILYNDGFLLRTQPFIYSDTTACHQILSPSGKYTWTSNGLYADTLLNVLGCDSIIRFRVTIRSNHISVDTIVKLFYTSPSGRFTWDSTGLYADSLKNRFGCDSIMHINLKITSRKFTFDTANCNPISYWSKSNLITQSGTFFDTIPNSLGGDSLITIKFVLGANQSLIDTSYCSQIISPSGKYIYTISGTYKDTLLNKVFCDSVITINYLRTMNTDTLIYAFCDSILLPSGKTYISQSGAYYDTLMTVNGCDSFLFINYSNLKSFSQISLSFCDSLISPSGRFVFKTSGVFRDTLRNQNNCDSIIILTIGKSNKNLSITKSNDIDCKIPFAALQAEGEGLFNFLWSPSDGIDDVNASQVKANPKNNIIYFLSATDSLGCLYTDSVSIEVNLLDSIGFFPNVFTPNNDGINDCLPMNSLTDFKELDFIVFNRWGNVIFETRNPLDCWQGNAFNGEKVTEGVYYYILKGNSICGHEKSLHGTITVIR
jgi:gliding motility-associated-like protein